MKKFLSGEIAAFKALTSASSRPVVLTHTHPDGDAVGSSLAAALYLRQTLPGADVKLVYEEEVPESVAFLLEGEQFLCAETAREDCEKAIVEADLLLVLDLNTLSRLGSLEDAARRSSAPRVLVDHHLNPDMGDFSMVISDTGISSASELLYWVLRELSGEDVRSLPAKALTALMTGMTTDTNNFSNSVVPSTLEMASELLAAGVDREMILERLYHSYPERRVRAFAHLLGSVMVVRPEGYAYMILSASDKERFALKEGELEGLVNVPLTIGEVRLSIFLKEEGDRYRVSIRSKKGVSANALARRRFNGGGHELAAGGKLLVPGDLARWEDAAGYIEEAVRDLPGLRHDSCKKKQTV